MCFWFFYFKQQQPLRPILVETSCPNIRMDPKLCPADPNWIAFIHSNDIWISNIETREERRLTFVHNGNASQIKISTPPLHFSCQTEFSDGTRGSAEIGRNGHWLFHFVCHFCLFPLVQMLWDDYFLCTVDPGRMRYLLNTYGRVLLKHSAFLFTGTAFSVWRSCGWNQAGGKFLPVQSVCRAF